MKVCNDFSFSTEAIKNKNKILFSINTKKNPKNIIFLPLKSELWHFCFKKEFTKCWKIKWNFGTKINCEISVTKDMLTVFSKLIY